MVSTPDEKILKGISRSIVNDILTEKHIEVLKRTITIDEIYAADEVFLSSTTKKILPVTMVDEKIIGNGTVGNTTNAIMERFNSIQQDWGK